MKDNNKYIEDVIEDFDRSLDAHELPISVLGHEFNPSEVLKELNINKYLRELDRFIEENYLTSMSGDDGDVTYISLNNGSEDHEHD